jgi:gamma-glutamylcyclotransferase (GGCT)/AIG2-like uncharacterized protein YtfP
MDYLFSYGTLLPEHAPAEIASIVRKLLPVGEGIVCGRLYDLGEYPGAVLDAETPQTIFGRVFKVPTRDLLKALDNYEGYNPADCPGSLFVRQRCAVVMRDGAKLPCWVYVYNRETGPAPLIPHGDYTKLRVG